MSHNITVRENGQAEAMYAMDPAWHGLGTVLDHAPGGYEALKASRLLWENEQYPLVAVVPVEEIDPATGDIVRSTKHVPITSKVANLRSDTLAELGIVGTSYSPVQNVEAFSFMDSLVDDNSMRYEAAGSLNGGSTVWLLARMPGQQQVAEGDVLKQYLLFTNSHDGSSAIRVHPTCVRVVCQNTLNLARGEAKKNKTATYSIRHSGNVIAKLDQVRTAIRAANVQFGEFAYLARQMVAAPFGTSLQSMLTFRLWPDAKKGVNNSRRIKARNRVMMLMDDAPQRVDGIHGSAWAAYNAVTQYIDHELSVGDRSKRMTMKRMENRMSSTLFGHGAQMKDRAMTEVRSLAGLPA